MCLSEPLEFSQSDNFQVRNQANFDYWFVQGMLTQSHNLQVDVDTYDEGDSLSMRESLGRSWEAENSNTSSPADSASTCSSSSKKRHK